MKRTSKLPALVESKYYEKSQFCGLKIKNFQTKRRARGVAGWSTTLNGRYDVTGIIGNMLQVSFGFYTRKNFFGNYPHLAHGPSELSARPVRN